ncbi:heme oxygenase 1 [Amanita muscaria]
MTRANHDEEQLDYSQPLATLMRKGTIKQHDTVSESPGAKLLTSGELSMDEYVRYLMMLWHIYSALEQALDQHATHPALESTYNPSLLARTSSLCLAAPLTPVPLTDRPNCSHMPTCDTSLTSVAGKWFDTSMIATAYDLKGSLRPQIKANAADSDSNSSDQTLFSYGPVPGVTFYAFRSLHSNKPANQGEINRIKLWFKDGMNSAGEKLGVVGKRAILSEVKKAYELNGALLALREPAASSVDHSDDSSVKPKPKSNTSASPVHIVIVLLAVCLAHFVWSTSVANLQVSVKNCRVKSGIWV